MEPLNELQSLPMMKQVETWLLSEEDMGMVVSDRVKDYETWLLSDEEKSPNMKTLGFQKANAVSLDALMDSYISNIVEPARMLKEAELPVRVRFKPTNKDLLFHYLGKRLTGGILQSNAMKDFNVYSKEPWLLPGVLCSAQ